MLLCKIYVRNILAADMNFIISYSTIFEIMKPKLFCLILVSTIRNSSSKNWRLKTKSLYPKGRNVYIFYFEDYKISLRRL